MSAVHFPQPDVILSPGAQRRDDALAVLAEKVTQLAERVELLETREGIARARVAPTRSRLGSRV